MRVLIDSSVWSLAFRRKDRAPLNEDERHLVARLQDAVLDGRAVLIGPVRQEVLSGIKEQAHFERLRKSMADFIAEQIMGEDYLEAAKISNYCTSHKVVCKHNHALICAIAMRRGMEIMTMDEGLQRCIELLKNEGILK